MSGMDTGEATHHGHGMGGMATGGMGGADMGGADMGTRHITAMTWAAWRCRAACGWLAGAPTVTGSGWTSCTCRWARSCRTGRPGWSSI